MKTISLTNPCDKIINLLLLVTILAGCQLNTAPDLITKNIDQAWKFKKSTDTTWLPATVPGTVHTDLLQNKIISEPFYRDEESKLQWIEKESWNYCDTFDLNDDIFSKKNILLHFDGLDTYADVSLNGQKILVCNNMFRSWQADVKSLLKEKGNILEITFLPAALQDSVKTKSLPYKLPDTRVFSRKAAYQYSWDWGPRFVTSGIWRSVRIEAWNNCRIQNIFISTDRVNSDKAVMKLEVNFLSSTVGKADIDLLINNTHLKSKGVDVNEGSNKITFPFEIENPALWWSNGLGEPHLYQAEVRLSVNNGLSDVKNARFGIRKIELVRESDSIGRSFYLKLNGQPVFMKGANYIPPDNFMPRVTNEKYKAVIESVKEANMNMLRVWGGGNYENENFYDLCDENGILVWQDFMFACNLYPGNEGFLENIKQEAEDNIIRLRNHPSLALWCGNNEIDEAWHNWGWQKQFAYSFKDSIEIWNNYLKIFDQILPEALHKLDPSRPYHPSSPSIGWGHPESLLFDDSHYWGVWWGEQPFEIFPEKIGRFMSEYGFQGMPDMKSIKKFTLPDDRKIGSPVMQVHQKHPRGTELINLYMERDYKVPARFEDYVYVSQLLQAEGIVGAVEAHRRSMPRCMGTLYWQLNDCWPVTSWSSIDYYGNWKALHYLVGKAFAGILVSPVLEEGKLCVYVVSDAVESFPAALQMKIIDFNGNIIWQHQKDLLVKSSSAEKQFATKLTYILKNKSMNDVVFSATILKAGKPLSSNHFYFNKPKFLNLPEAKPEFTIQKTAEGYRISITTERLLKNLHLEVDGYDGKFNDNYFDVLPGELLEVNFITDQTIPDFKNKLTYRTLNEINHKL